MEEEAVKSVRVPPRSPHLNTHIEAVTLSVTCECLSQLILFGEKMLRNALCQYLKQGHTARDHQSLGNRIIEPGEEVGWTDGEIVCDERLGSLLQYYRRTA